MSIIDSLKPKPVTAKAVSNDLSKANADLATLKSKLADASLAVVEGKPGAEKALAELNAGMAAARDRIAMLGAAHSRLVAREEAEVAAQRAALHKTQVAALQKHLAARDAAAEAFVAAMTEATKHYHDLLDRSAKAKAVKPILSAWPEWEDDVCEPAAIRRLAAGEFYRLSANPGDLGGRALPGANFLSSDWQRNPGAVPPMLDAIRRSSAAVMAKITGKAPE